MLPMICINACSRPANSLAGLGHSAQMMPICCGAHSLSRIRQISALMSQRIPLKALRGGEGLCSCARPGGVHGRRMRTCHLQDLLASLRPQALRVGPCRLRADGLMVRCLDTVLLGHRALLPTKAPNLCIASRPVLGCEALRVV